MGKRILSCALAAVVLVMAFSSGAFAQTESTEAHNNSLEMGNLEVINISFEGEQFTVSAAGFPDEEDLQLFSDGNKAFDDNNPGYGSQLKEGTAARAIYDEISSFVELAESNLSEFSDGAQIQVDLSSYQVAVGSLQALVSDSIYAYVYDHPDKEFFSSEGYSYYQSSNIVQSVIIYFAPIDDAVVLKKKLDSSISAFQNEFYAEFGKNSSGSEMEKYWFIQNYLGSRTCYDKTLALPFCHSAYGFLAKDTPVVCEGYAKAYKALCDSVGLPCMLILGESIKSGESFTGDVDHMWNAIRVDGNWYSMDVTWDDVDDMLLYDSSEVDPEYPFSISTVQHQYFLNNDYFDDGADTEYKVNANHMQTGNIISASTPYELPDFVEGENSQYSGTDTLELEILEIGVEADEFLAVHVINILNSYGFTGGARFYEADDIIISIKEDTRMIGTLEIPAEKTFTITSEEGCYTLTGESPMIRVESALTLENVTLVTEDGFDPSNPIINVAEGGVYAEKGAVSVNGYIAYSDNPYIDTSKSEKAYFHYPEHFLTGADVIIHFNDPISDPEDLICYQIGYLSNGKMESAERVALVGIEVAGDFSSGAKIELIEPEDAVDFVKLVLVLDGSLIPISETPKWQII